MQKTEITSTYLVVQNTYETVQVGLFVDDTLLDFHEAHKHYIGRDLMVLIDDMLRHQDRSFHDLNFIVVSIGPAPFTTLRALLATVNGINLSCNTPLVGIDTLALLMASPEQRHTVTLLNAFNNDVYFAFYDQQNNLITGCENIILLLQELAGKKIAAFIGNGAELHKEIINSYFPESVISAEPSYPTIEELATAGLAAFMHGNVQQELFPLYTKTVHYKRAL